MSTSTVESIVPAITDADRAARLTEAGGFWTNHVNADKKNAQLTYLVKGFGEGSVASRITAGKHEFYIDEPAGLAGDDVAASPVEIALGALIACQIVVYRLYAQGLGIQIDTIEAKAEGDLLATVEIAVPSHVSDKAKKALEAFEELLPEADPREDLLNKAGLL